MIEVKFPTIYLSINELIPYPDNPKLHNDEQIALLAGRITKEGFNQPIVIDENKVIVKGHGRRLAAIKLGLEEVPVIVLDGLSKAEIKAARLADNVISLRTDNDKELLKLELSQLTELDMSLPEFGFDDFMISKLDLFSEEAGSADAKEPKPVDDLDTKNECPMCQYAW